MKLLAVTVVLLASTLAQAGDLMKVSCLVSTGVGATSFNAELASGMRETVDCDPKGCVGAEPFEMVMNYNGNGYEDLTVEITHKKSGAMTSMTHHDLRAGSHFVLALGSAKKLDSGLSLDCDIEAIETKQAAPATK